jgi:hypothetical protein
MSELTHDELRTTALYLLAKAKDNHDTEDAHCEADAALCTLLVALGFKDVVDAWGEIDKWYA